MEFQLPALNFSAVQLEGFLSRETLYLHYERHHKGYIEKTNQLLASEFLFLKDKTLEEICRVAENPLADQARQAWNHTFYWECIKSDIGGVEETPKLEELVLRSFGDFVDFEQCFKRDAQDIFGSGWLWLVLRKRDQKLELIKAQGADQPFWDNSLPLLVCDVWEHAYYVDYRNERAAYVDAFWNRINWEFAEKNIDSSEVFSASEKMRGKETETLIKEEEHGRARHYSRGA